jgi:hypothetical protein
MNTFTLILIFFSSFTFANQNLTVKGSFELLKDRIYPDQKFYPKRSYYNFSYKTDMPRKHTPLNTRTPWKSSGIMFFTNDQFDLTQIALYTKQCAVDLNSETKSSLLQQAHELVKRETFILFGKTLNLKEQPLKKLKESHKEWNRINIKEKLPSVSKIRVSRGFYKCDGRSGIGYRVDFFIDQS